MYLPVSFLWSFFIIWYIYKRLVFVYRKLYNYTDDNSMSYSSTTLRNVLSNLRLDCKIAIDWFEENGIKANPNKFQFMILSTNATDDIELKLDRNTILSSERSVKALGVTIDYRLTFNDHISAWCLKAATQLNALARISKYLDIKSKKSFSILSEEATSNTVL